MAGSTKTTSLGTAVPAAIIFVNENISASVKSTLIRQLEINTVYTGSEFDGYVDGYTVIDGSYKNTVQEFDLRVLVLRDFVNRGTVTTWPLADVVIYAKNGLACVERNLYGPPGASIQITGISWSFLGFH